VGLKSLFGREARVAVPAETEERARVLYDSDAGFTEILNGAPVSDTVTMREAMSLPAVWAAINFLSGTMAGLPIEVFEKNEKDGGDPKVSGGIADVLGAAVNDQLTSFEWREAMFAEVFGPGRGYSYLERDGKGDVINIFPMEFDRVTVRKSAGKVFYEYRESNGKPKTYPARDVIDIAYLRKTDFVSSYNPVLTCGSAIKQGLNANRYALTVFGKNGIPPYTLKGAFQTAKEAVRAAADMMKATRRAAEEGKPILPIPAGTDLQRLGDDPEKMQLTSVQKFAVEQAARIYQLPPMFLQDLSKGNFANTEQQDLHLVKHTVRRWVKKFEQELTLKLFGRGAKRYVKLNIDALLRGDFKTRMEGSARAVNSGLLTPNEGRALEGREALDGGSVLMIQGATVPITMAGKVIAAPPKPTD